MRRVVKVAVIVFAVTLVLAAAAYKTSRATSWQVFGTLVDRVETTDKVVALTFDDGPTDADLDAVLAMLADKHVKGTFFLVGNEIAKHPAAAQALVAAGHQVGNHSWSHTRMIAMSPATIADEVERTDAALRTAGAQGDLMFRPPYGKKLLGLPWYLSRHHRTTVMWDVAVEYDVAQPSAQTVADATLAQVRPGSIVLLHPWYGHTATREATGMIIDELRRQGYRFVTVSELIHG